MNNSVLVIAAIVFFGLGVWLEFSGERLSTKGLVFNILAAAFTNVFVAYMPQIFTVSAELQNSWTLAGLRFLTFVIVFLLAGRLVVRLSLKRPVKK